MLILVATPEPVRTKLLSVHPPSDGVQAIAGKSLCADRLAHFQTTAIRLQESTVVVLPGMPAVPIVQKAA
jgi:hypothetical protein